MRHIAAKNLQGLTTIELLIAFALLITAIGGATAIVFGSQSFSLDSKQNREALIKASALLETTRALGREDFMLVNPVPKATAGIYKTWVEVETEPDFFTKKVTSHVTWTGYPNRLLQTSLSSLVTNWQGVQGGNTCDTVLTGDWQHPQNVTFQFGAHFLGDNINTFPITDLDAYNRKLFVTVNNTKANNAETFFILDITNPLNPILVHKLDNDPNVSAGLNAVKVVGDYAYVASFSSISRGQLQIINLRTYQITTYKVPSVTGGSGQGLGNSVYYYNGLIYLGLTKAASGPEFIVLDVGGEFGGKPDSPIYVGAYDANNGINAIFVRGNYAYLATPNNEELTILDVSVPTNPQRVAGFNAPGGSGNGKSIAMVGSTLYLGRTLGNIEFYILDVVNPQLDVGLLGAKDIGTNESINGIVIRDYLAMVITNKQFQIWNIANPADIKSWSSITLSSGSGTAVDCEGNTLYAASVPSSGDGYLLIMHPGP